MDLDYICTARRICGNLQSHYRARTSYM